MNQIDPKRSGSKLKGRELILGVTGGIAAYKAVELLREMVKRGANVHVVMTENAMKFVTPLTFQTLSGHPVLYEMFRLLEGSRIGHIAMSDRAELMVIAPATANILGKIANGIADDLLTTMVMAMEVPVLFAPSMNVKMWQSPVVQHNVAKLKSYGYHFVEPAEGDLACGSIGRGRLAEIPEIVEKIEDLFTPKDLKDTKILVTAGPTIEPIDPVRYITNPSSGKMGFALAKMAKRRGAQVLLITGPTDLSLPRRDIPIIRVKTAKEMYEAVMDNFEDYEVIIKSAAVVDFRPKNFYPSKIKKETNQNLLLELEPNPDILAELGKRKGSRILVGFAAETDQLIENAQEKLRKKNLDLIIANDITQMGAGFQSDTNIVKIIDASGRVRGLPLMSKDLIADIILNEIANLLKKRKEKKPWPEDWD